MKITVSTKPLAACLKAVLPAIATRPGVPILSCVRLDASRGGLKVEATDLELTARRKIAETHSTSPEGLRLSIEAGIDGIQHPEMVDGADL